MKTIREQHHQAGVPSMPERPISAVIEQYTEWRLCADRTARDWQRTRPSALQISAQRSTYGDGMRLERRRVTKGPIEEVPLTRPHCSITRSM